MSTMKMERPTDEQLKTITVRVWRQAGPDAEGHFEDYKVDEVSDDQDGKGARQTGEVFLNAMRYPDWDDGSALAQMTHE